METRPEFRVSRIYDFGVLGFTENLIGLHGPGAQFVGPGLRPGPLLLNLYIISWFLLFFNKFSYLIITNIWSFYLFLHALISPWIIDFYFTRVVCRYADHGHTTNPEINPLTAARLKRYTMILRYKFFQKSISKCVFRGKYVWTLRF